MVIGDNPTELMEQYQIGKEVEPYVVYKYKDAEKMKKNSIQLFEKMLENPRKFNLNDYAIDYIKSNLKAIKNMTSFDYYKKLVDGFYINDNGDAISTDNPNGKWETYKLAKNFFIPLKLFNGEETNTALCKDIDWDSMHMQNTASYESVWEMIMEGREPKNDIEKIMYENMSTQQNYLSQFKDKDQYVIHNCAYWTYAFLDKDGWHDMDDAISDFDWIMNFFDRYINKIDKGAKVTIFECSKDKLS